MSNKQITKRVVIKIGTKVITGSGFELDRARIASIVSQVGRLAETGTQVILVSSGAIGSGMGLLGLTERPKTLQKLQACAAVGQLHLMKVYDELFRARSILTAQILLTGDDLNDRKRYLNAKGVLLTLLEEGVVPVINENDTVSTDEIKFGDNDKLSSLVANLVGADLLILLSNVDGLYNYSNGENGKELITVVNRISGDIEAMAQKSKDELGTGGMTSKLQAAKMAASSGIPCVIANGTKDGVILDIVEGRQAGTLFMSCDTRLAARKCWLLFGARQKGSIKVDDGAKDALTKKHKSLLASGIISADGEFKKGEIVSICDISGKEFAKGVVNYSSKEIDKIRGLKTAQITKALGCKKADEVVHKDNLVTLQ